MAADQPLNQSERRICFNCVGEKVLSRRIEADGLAAHCFYCGQAGQTFSIDEMANEIKLAFDEHACRTEDSPERRGDKVADVIGMWAVIDTRPAEDIRCTLEERNEDFDMDTYWEECSFHEDAHYEKNDAEAENYEFHSRWRELTRILQTESRYFNRTVQDTLASIFEGISEHANANGRPIVVKAGPGEPLNTISRARVFQSPRELEVAGATTALGIGPPPTRNAIAGRMNPHGISVFYGAKDSQTALAEVRPPVGSLVWIGRFDLIRSLRLLDIEALQSAEAAGSWFDRSYIHRRRRGEFLSWLSEQISRPVVPNAESFDHIETQAVTEFLATMTNPTFDGIIYPSAQRVDGRNVVLFHKAASVEPLPHMFIVELVERTTTEGVEFLPQLRVVPSDASDPEKGDKRLPVLKLDISSIEVRQVNAIAYTAPSQPAIAV